MVLITVVENSIGKEILRTGGTQNQKPSNVFDISIRLILDFRYKEMTRCMIEQYSNFTIKELNNQPVNGKLTLVKILDNRFIQFPGRKYCGQRRA